MSVEIYWGSGSPYAWRVLLAAEARGVPYESRLLSFSAKEHRAPAFLAINPRGKVPALKDGDRIVTESLAIMHHLDGLGSGPALFGATAEERTRVLEWCSRIMSDLEAAVYGVCRPLMAAKPEADAAAKAEAALPALHRELGNSRPHWPARTGWPAAPRHRPRTSPPCPSSSTWSGPPARRPRADSITAWSRWPPATRALPHGWRGSRRCPATSGPTRRTGAQADPAGAAAPPSGTPRRRRSPSPRRTARDSRSGRRSHRPPSTRRDRPPAGRRRGS